GWFAFLGRSSLSSMLQDSGRIETHGSCRASNSPAVFRTLPFWTLGWLSPLYGLEKQSRDARLLFSLSWEFSGARLRDFARRRPRQSHRQSRHRSLNLVVLREIVAGTKYPDVFGG